MKLKKMTLALAGVGILSLQACGGGGSSVNLIPAPTTTTTTATSSTTETTTTAETTSTTATTSATPPSTATETPATTSVPVTVIDGPIHKAKVCLDVNNNGACDAGEPSAETDTSGKANLVVDAKLAGKSPVVAVVGTDAIDMDRPNEKIATTFTMRAPADQPSMVTPLTTLVQDVVESAGLSTADAEKQIKQLTGINVSLFEDFTKGTTENHKTAATVARMVVVTTQQQAEAVKTAVDQNNVAIPKADLDKTVKKRLQEMLPSLVAALQDPSVVGAADAAAKEAALLAQAKTVVASEGIKAEAAATVVAIDKAAAAPEGTRVSKANLSLANLTLTDLYNWSVRMTTASLAQDTPDANGNVKYVWRHFASSGTASQNATAAWSSGSGPRRQADLHWNGAKWVACDINFENTTTVRDAKGKSSYNYCDGMEKGTSTRASTDVSGKQMIDVYKDIRAAGYTNLSIGGADHVTATSLLGSGVFPADSQVRYSTSTITDTAVAYYPGKDNAVTLYPASVAAGTKEACASDTSKPIPAANLEELVSRSPGAPCVFTANAKTGPKNEAWYASSVSMGTIGSVPTQDVTISTLTSANYYTGNKRLRVAFGADKAAKYYSCQERADGSPRNCDVVGTGTYAIQTLDDARVMTFSGMPALFASLGYSRVFVERAGKVWYGYKDLTGTVKSARLNTAAATALLKQINPGFVMGPGTNTDPETPLKLTAASFQGTWHVTRNDLVTDPGAEVVVSSDGSVTCKWLGTNPLPGEVCFASVSATGNFSMTETAVGYNPLFTATGQLNFLSGLGEGTFVDAYRKTNGTGLAVRK